MASINLLHYQTSFWRRSSFYWLLMGVAIIWMVLIRALGATGTEPWKFYLAGVAAIAYLLYKIWGVRFYVADFISDGQKVKIRYFFGSTEKKIETNLAQVEVKLWFTQSRFRRTYYLALKVEEEKFYIYDNSDWSRSEMMELIEFVRAAQNKPLSKLEMMMKSKM